MTKVTKIQGLILICVLMLAATAANAGGRCFSAEIPEAMILPSSMTMILSAFLMVPRR